MESSAVYLVVDYEGVCRLCLQARGALSELFEPPQQAQQQQQRQGLQGQGGADDAPGPPLAEQIRTLTDVTVAEGDGLPRRICHRCRYVVEACYELRTIALRSNRLLLASIEAHSLVGDVTTQAYRKTNDDEMDAYADGEQSEESGDPFRDVVFLRSGGARSEPRAGADAYGACETVEESSCATADHVVEECHREFTSSSEVTLDEIKIEAADGCSQSALMYASDDAASDGPSQQKDGDRGMPRHHSCLLCLETFSERTTLTQHVHEHYKDTALVPYADATKPFACQECQLSFALRADLIAHHRKHLDINPYSCKVAGCTFDIRSREALRHHMYTHASKKFVCTQCGARYRKKVEIIRHRVRHLDEGQLFRCGICFVVCKNRLSLKAHLKNHEIGKRFKCEFPGCPKAFYSNSDLTVHSRSHSNDKCFKCPLCVCAYTSQSQLNRHLRRHEKPGPTKCDKCSESFEDYGSFCNHRIATHGEWQPHRCKGCNQGYQSEQQLEKHLTRCEVALRMKEIHGTISLTVEDKDSTSYMEQSDIYK